MAARFCGRCGFPNPTGAGFCGNCGSSLGSPAWVAVAAAPLPSPTARIAAPAVAPTRYRYAYTPVAAPGARLNPVALAAVLGGVLGFSVLVFSLLAGLAIRGVFTPCTAFCGPVRITPLPEVSSFTSRAYGYEVGYPSSWTIQQEDDGGVVLTTRLHGSFAVRGQKGGEPDEQLIREAIAGLPSSQWQNVQEVSSVHGAHIGGQDGAGKIYSAQLMPAAGQAQHVRIAVLAAHRGSLSIVAVGVDPADVKGSPNGIPEANAFDYVLAEFGWPG